MIPKGHECRCCQFGFVDLIFWTKSKKKKQTKKTTNKKNKQKQQQLNMAKSLCKSRVCNSSNKIWSEFCDLNAYALPIFLLCGNFQITISKTVRCKHKLPYYAMSMRQNSKVNSGYVTLAIWSEFCDLYAHALPISLLCCKFQIIILKTVWEVAETRTQLFK